MERTFTARTELEAILVEQALAMTRELEMATDAATDGQVLAVAEAADRAYRDLLTPPAAVAYAAGSDAEAFTATWRPKAEALGVAPDGPLTVLGDGVEWIWRAATERFPATGHVLDDFHAS